jgi:hypothetical protein
LAPESKVPKEHAPIDKKASRSHACYASPFVPEWNRFHANATAATIATTTSGILEWRTLAIVSCP